VKTEDQAGAGCSLLPLSNRAHINRSAAVLEVPMDYLLEALKFIERARNATNPDVVRTDLEMARWFLSQAIKEKSEVSSQVRASN
jgi:hypothetical protein